MHDGHGLLLEHIQQPLRHRALGGILQMREQRADAGRVLDIPQQYMVLRRMAEATKRQPQLRQQRAERVALCGAGCRQMQRPPWQPGIDAHQPGWLPGYLPPHRERMAGPRHWQACVRLFQMQQGLPLKIRHRRVFGRMDNLQHVFAAIGGAQMEVAVPLSGQRLRDRLQAEMLPRQGDGVVRRGGRGRRVQDFSQLFH
ncbi:hypothetical protein HMPREF9946_04192 [Acetobacteraceae bacterium AT-5844]|nr:hypothetical protein HMPREF9946_04192 [Acetobacteraceae bacterium AT-5844]